MKKFLDSGMTKAELARRLGSRPDRVNHILASPANWTIRTIAELLAAISQEEFIPHSTKLAGRLPRNITQADLLLGIKKQSSTNAETASGSRAHTVKLELAA
jgi:hypothetical protein